MSGDSSDCVKHCFVLAHYDFGHYCDPLTLKIIWLEQKLPCFLSAAKTEGEKTPTNTNWKVMEMLSRNAEHIDCKKHFELAKEAMIEVAKVRKTKHNKYNINYHLVCCLRQG